MLSDFLLYSENVPYRNPLGVYFSASRCFCLLDAGRMKLKIDIIIIWFRSTSRLYVDAVTHDYYAIDTAYLMTHAVRKSR